MNYALRHEFDIDIPKFSLKNNVVYKPEAKDMNDMLNQEKYNIKLFDEGYLVAMNLMPIDKFLLEFIQTVNITRSKNNYIGFCFQNMDRAIRALKERFNIWVHKTHKQRAYLFAKSNLFITKDPWATKKLLDCGGDELKMLYFLNHNPNKVCTFRTKAMKEKPWKHYKALKNQAQDEIKRNREIREGITQSHNLISEELYERINVKKDLAIGDIPDFLREKYDFDEPEIKGSIKRYYGYSTMAKYSRAHTKRRDEEESA